MKRTVAQNKKKPHPRIVALPGRLVQLARFSTVSVPRPEKRSETPTVSLYAAIIEGFEAAIACQKHRFRDEDGCTCCAMAVVA
jgi:hypothetical protein